MAYEYHYIRDQVPITHTRKTYIHRPASAVPPTTHQRRGVGEEEQPAHGNWNRHGYHCHHAHSSNLATTTHAPAIARKAHTAPADDPPSTTAIAATRDKRQQHQRGRQTTRGPAIARKPRTAPARRPAAHNHHEVTRDRRQTTSPIGMPVGSAIAHRGTRTHTGAQATHGSRP